MSDTTTNATQMLTPRQVAQQLGVTLHYVYALLWSGKLRGEKQGSKWYVSAESLEQWKGRMRNASFGEEACIRNYE